MLEKNQRYNAHFQESEKNLAYDLAYDIEKMQ